MNGNTGRKARQASSDGSGLARLRGGSFRNLAVGQLSLLEEPASKPQAPFCLRPLGGMTWLATIGAAERN
jgi:hypothetical protein